MVTYKCAHPEVHIGHAIGDGECVAFVKHCAGAPSTKQWKQGSQVRGNIHLEVGTAIATFVDGKYANLRYGNHATIYVSQDAKCLWVYDQWAGTGVHKRPIYFKHGLGPQSNDGDAYYVIE